MDGPFPWANVWWWSIMKMRSSKTIFYKIHVYAFSFPLNKLSGTGNLQLLSTFSDESMTMFSLYTPVAMYHSPKWPTLWQSQARVLSNFFWLCKFAELTVAENNTERQVWDCRVKSVLHRMVWYSQLQVDPLSGYIC